MKRRSFAGVISAALFGITVAAFLRPPLLPAIGRDLGLSAVGLGALGSVFAIGRLAVDVPTGRLSDRIAPGPMMFIAGSLVAAGSGILALAPVAGVAYVAVLVLGAGSAWALTTAQAYFATAPRARRGAAMSMFAGSLLIGQAIGPVVGGGIGAGGGWRLAIGAGSLLAAVSVVPLLRVPSPPPAGHDGHGPRQAGDDRVAFPVLAVIYLLPAVQFAIGAAMVQTLVPIVADEQLGIGAAVVGSVLGVGGLARLAAAVVAGRVMDTVGRRPAMIPGLVLQLAGVVVFAVWPGLPSLWISILLVSLGSVSVNVGTAMLADLSEGGRLGPRLGAFRFTGDFSFMVMPLLSGWLLDRSGRLVAMMPLTALTGLVLIGAVILVPETHPVSSRRRRTPGSTR